MDSKPLKVVADPDVALTAIERKKLFDMAMEMHELQRVANQVQAAVTPLNARVAAIKKEIGSRNDVPADVKTAVDGLAKDLGAVVPKFAAPAGGRGGRRRRGGGGGTPPVSVAGQNHPGQERHDGRHVADCPDAPRLRRGEGPGAEGDGRSQRGNREGLGARGRPGQVQAHAGGSRASEASGRLGREQEIARHVVNSPHIARRVLVYALAAACQIVVFAAPATEGKAAGQAPAATTEAALATAKPGRLPSQPIDEEYTKKIKEYTTEPFFLSPVIDYLPASKTVPTPKAVLGDIAGAPGKLPYSKEVYEYMRLLAKSTPRVKVYTIGTTEEGREMIAVAVASEALMAKLDQNKADLAKLADPRTIKLDDAVADEIARRAAPVYYITGAIHSNEAGAPTALMELAYRLAVDDSPYIRNIREHVITLITPIVEPDGRDRWWTCTSGRRSTRTTRRRTRSTGASTWRTTTTATRWA